MSNAISRGETRVNTSTSDDQSASSITTLPDGGWVVTWMSNGTDGSGLGIYQQRYTANGLPAGGEIRVNSTTAGDQAYPTVTALSNGGWVVTWESIRDEASGTGWDVYQQRFNARGIHVGHETRVNTFTSGEQSFSSMTALSDGGWLVTWSSVNQDGSGTGIYQQRYSSSGLPEGTETRVNTTTNGYQTYSSVTKLAGNGWLVTWTSENIDGSGWVICQQRYDASGNAVGGEVRVNTFANGHQRDPSVTPLANGGWVVIWTSEGQDGSAGGIYQKRYDVTGSPMGFEVRVNTTTVNSQSSAKVTNLSDGGWVVVWTSYDQDGDMGGIYQQRYDANGQAIGGEARVNTTTNDHQALPSVSTLPDGGWVVIWTSDDLDGSGRGIYQQRFNQDGEPIGPTTPTGIDLSASQIAEGCPTTLVVGKLSALSPVLGEGCTYKLLDDAGGRFEIVGSELRVKNHIKLDFEQGASHTIKVQVRDVMGATLEKSLTIAVADMDSERLVGSSSADLIKGGRNVDIFHGVNGNDELWGGAGNDKLYGGLGKDQLKGEAGKDAFVFDTKLNKSTNVDKILDFSAPSDSIWLDNSIFTKLGSGTASRPKKFGSDMFVKASKAQDAEDRIVYDEKKGVLYYDKDGTGSSAQVKIATLSKNLQMTYKDFFVI